VRDSGRDNRADSPRRISGLTRRPLGNRSLARMTLDPEATDGD